MNQISELTKQLDEIVTGFETLCRESEETQKELDSLWIRYPSSLLAANHENSAVKQKLEKAIADQRAQAVLFNELSEKLDSVKKQLKSLGMAVDD